MIEQMALSVRVGRQVGAVDGAVESAVGVLLYQMGIAGGIALAGRKLADLIEPECRKPRRRWQNILGKSSA